MVRGSTLLDSYCAPLTVYRYRTTGVYDVPLSPRTALMSVDKTRALTGCHVATRYTSAAKNPIPAATKIARNTPTQPQLVATGWPLTRPVTGAGAGAWAGAGAGPGALLQPQNVRTADAQAANARLDCWGPPTERSMATSFRSPSGCSSVARWASRCTTIRAVPAARSNT